MSYEMVFAGLTVVVIPAWLLLVFMPRAGLTKTLVHSAVYPVGIGIFYIVVLGLFAFFGQAAPGSDFTSISGIGATAQHPIGVLIIWSHILLFDLFVGAWIARDSQFRGIAHLAVVPCMFFTFLLGPVGLIAYLGLRIVVRKGMLALDG